MVEIFEKYINPSLENFENNQEYKYKEVLKDYFHK